jgi:hypothetical protein
VAPTCPTHLPHRPRSGVLGTRTVRSTDSGSMTRSPPSFLSSLALNHGAMLGQQHLRRLPTSLSRRVPDLAASGDGVGEAKGTPRVESEYAEPPSPASGVSPARDRGATGAESPTRGDRRAGADGRRTRVQRGRLGDPAATGSGGAANRARGPKPGVKKLSTPPSLPGPTRTPKRVGVGGCPGGRV